MFLENDIELSFDKDLFKKDDFDSDEFLIKYKQKVDLETLQKDLALFSKEISTEVYDVLNENYSSFLNFTTKLSHFEKLYKEFVEPFNALKNEIDGVNTSLSKCEIEAQNCIREAIEKQEKEDEKKYCSNYTKKLDVCCTLLEENDLSIDGIFNEDHSLTDEANLGPKNNGEWAPTQEVLDDLLEKLQRCANEYGPLVFTRKSYPQNEEIARGHEKLDNLLSKLIQQLELIFVYQLTKYISASSGSRLTAIEYTSLHRTLRIYALINQYGEAENLLRVKCVKPSMEKIVRMENLEKEDTGVEASVRFVGLTNIYDDIYKFIGQRVAPLIYLTGGRLSDLSSAPNQPSTLPKNVCGPVPGFEFLKNSIWPEIVRRFEACMSPVYAPANPDAFHKNYTDTLVFMDKVESILATDKEVDEFRKLSSYQDFMVKPWHTSVYFQIRFQEIAGSFEESLFIDPFKLNTPSPLDQTSHVPYFLRISTLMHDSLVSCWDEGHTYLRALCHKFWKLSLQIVSRHRYWLKHDVVRKSERLTDELIGIYLIADVKQIVSELPEIFKVHISCKIENLLATAPKAVPEKLNEPMSIDRVKDIFLNDALNDYDNVIIPDLIRAATEKPIVNSYERHAKRITDIPRIYRHTKRTPKDASDYVLDMLRPLNEFMIRIDEKFGKSYPRITAIRGDILRSGCELLTGKYLETVKELLINVHKTEESLLRLKKVKGLLNNTVMATTPENESNPLPGEDTNTRTVYTTDGAKIRAQLKLDIVEYGKQVRTLLHKSMVAKLGLPISEVSNYQTLLESVG